MVIFVCGTPCTADISNTVRPLGSFETGVFTGTWNLDTAFVFVTENVGYNESML